MQIAQLNERACHCRSSPNCFYTAMARWHKPARLQPTSYLYIQKSWVTPPQRQHRWPSAVWCFIKHLKVATVARFFTAIARWHKLARWQPTSYLYIQQSWVKPPQRQHRWLSTVWCFIKHVNVATINILHTGSYITAFSITTQPHGVAAYSPPVSCPSIAIC